MAVNHPHCIGLLGQECLIFRKLVKPASVSSNDAARHQLIFSVHL
jgi:hypothetical protein